MTFSILMIIAVLRTASLRLLAWLKASIPHAVIRRGVPRPRLLMPETLWQNLCHDLKISSDGRRESGAFLLGRKNKVASYMLYEDLGKDCFLDPVAIRLTGSAYSRLWEICRKQSLEPIADVHTHPGAEFQSSTDQENPMIARKGHIGLIIPDFAANNPTPSTTGVYQYLGPNQWRTVPESERHKTLRLTGG